MKPEIFDWPCGKCEKATPHLRYPEGPDQLPTSCSICGEQPFSMLQISKDNDSGGWPRLAGWRIVDIAAGIALLVLLAIGYWYTNPQLAWWKDYFSN
jgi:hypothetical protein